MLVVALSDTHLYRPDIPDGDVLIHAGDVCSFGNRQEFESEILWLSRHNHRVKLYVPGNHDKYVQAHLFEAVDFCQKAGIEMLVDRKFTVDGIEFYGSPWTPIFMNWAFMQNAHKAKAHWAKLPKCDVLITHGPPYGILDQCPESVGCHSLFEAVERTQPAVHLFGHIHERSGDAVLQQWGSTGSYTILANIACLDGRYRPSKAPIRVFTISLNADGSSECSFL